MVFLVLGLSFKKLKCKEFPFFGDTEEFSCSSCHILNILQIAFDRGNKPSPKPCLLIKPFFSSPILLINIIDDPINKLSNTSEKGVRFGNSKVWTSSECQP